MTEAAYPATAHDYATDSEELERLEAAMDDSPKGALAVSGVAVALLMICWFLIYAFVFLPRGTVG